MDAAAIEPSTALAQWRESESTRLLMLYGILIGLLFPTYHFVTNVLPGKVPDSLALRLISGGFSLLLVVVVAAFPRARKHAATLQFVNITVFLVMLLAVLVNSGNSNWFLTGIVIGLFGTQYAFLNSRDLVLSYLVAFAAQVAYSWFRGEFFHWTNVYAMGVVFFASVICVASGIVRIRSVTSEVAALLRLRVRVNTDELTGALNRNALNDSIDSTLEGARNDGKNLALVFVDLNDFKRVNDSYGHDVGDVALQKAADRLRMILSESQLLARIGGDEFVILDGAEKTDNHPENLARRIQEAFASPFDLGGGIITSIGASCGIALYPEDGRTRLELLSSADRKMYAAKGQRMHRRVGDQA